MPPLSQAQPKSTRGRWPAATPPPSLAAQPYSAAPAFSHFISLKREQIAEGVDCSEGTVMSRLFYARRNLRRALGEMLELLAERVTVAA